MFFGLILVFLLNPVAFAGVPLESTESTPNDQGEGRTELLSSKAAAGLSQEVLDRLLNPKTRLEAAMELLTSGSGFNLWQVKTLIRSLSANCQKILLSGEGVNANSREIDLSGG
jgi:hypothetical protein